MRRVLAVMLMSVPARGQLLDLDARAGRPATDVAATALIDRLGNVDESSTLRGEASAAVRRLALNLAQRGVDAGGAGGVHLLMARTIASHLDEIDRGLGDGSIDEGLLALLVHDLDMTRRDVPVEAEGVDRLVRDVFAQVLQRLGPAEGAHGWVGEGGPIAPEEALTDEWLGAAEAMGLSRGAIDVLGDLRVEVRAALGWAAFEGEASRMVRAIEGAPGVVDARFGWVPLATRDALVKRLNDAMVDLADRGVRADAIARLERMGRMAAAFEVADRLGSGLYADQARGALASVSLMEHDDRLANFERAAALAIEGVPAEETVIRPLRPALRMAAEEAARSRELLVRALGAVLRRDDAMSDPGVVASIGAHRRALEDVRAIGRVSAAISDAGAGTPEPIVDPTRRVLAGHLLELTRDEDRREDGMALLRAFDEQYGKYAHLDGEDALREAARQASTGSLTGGVWADATGFRLGELVAMIDRERGAWWEAWSREFGLGDEPRGSAALDALGMLVGSIELLSVQMVPATRTNPGEAVLSALEAWPGFELSRGAALAMCPAPGAFAEGARLAVAGRPGEAMDSIERVLEEHRAFELIGRLEVRAGELGLARTNDASSVLSEIGTGGPGAGAWMAGEREALADVCRYAEEVAALEALGEDEAAERAREYVEDVAQGVLEGMRE